MKIARIVDIRRGGFLGFGGHTERYIEIEAYNELMAELMACNPPDRYVQQAIEDVETSMVSNIQEGWFGIVELQKNTLEWLKGLNK